MLVHYLEVALCVADGVDIATPVRLRECPLSCLSIEPYANTCYCDSIRENVGRPKEFRKISEKVWRLNVIWAIGRIEEVLVAGSRYSMSRCSVWHGVFLRCCGPEDVSCRSECLSRSGRY